MQSPVHNIQLHITTILSIFEKLSGSYSDHFYISSFKDCMII